MGVPPAATATTLPAGATCAACIKGNISAAGERVYHFPGCPDYENTSINPSAGERTFSSEREAQAAGGARQKLSATMIVAAIFLHFRRRGERQVMSEETDGLTLRDFVVSFSYGSRNDLNFKYLKNLPVEEAAQCLQELLHAIPDAIDANDVAGLQRLAYEWQRRGYRTAPVTPIQTVPLPRSQSLYRGAGCCCLPPAGISSKGRTRSRWASRA